MKPMKVLLLWSARIATVWLAFFGPPYLWAYTRNEAWGFVWLASIALMALILILSDTEWIGDAF